MQSIQTDNYYPHKAKSFSRLTLSKYQQKQLIMYQRIISWPLIICKMLTLLCMMNDDLYPVCTFILIFEPTKRLSAISKSTFIDDRERVQ